MAMSMGSSKGPMVEINTTPLIDVMLVLLVTLIITLPVMTHSVKMDLPQNQHQQPPPTPPEVINLGIDFDGTITWNGTVVPNMQVLDGYFASESVKDPQPEIHLNPDGMAKYGIVAKVLADAQRNRLTKIGFVNTSEFAQ
ncbi:MAG: ExbD/TolR family protein [Steroidobacteraceae bacterium]|jgi:biopolymer transport protein ExbD